MYICPTCNLAMYIKKDLAAEMIKCFCYECFGIFILPLEEKDAESS